MVSSFNASIIIREIYKDVDEKNFMKMIKEYDATKEVALFNSAMTSLFGCPPQYTKDDYFKEMIDDVVHGKPGRTLDYGTKYAGFINYAQLRVQEFKMKKMKKDASPKKKTISKTLRRTVWNKHIGEDIGKAKCMCCNMTDISQLNFECGHVVAEAKGGSIDIANLRPICSSCNKSMGTVNMDNFVKSFRG